MILRWEPHQTHPGNVRPVIDAMASLLLIAAGLFFVLYATAMWRALLDTPEPGWEWALAWEYTKEALMNFWEALVQW